MGRKFHVWSGSGISRMSRVTYRVNGVSGNKLSPTDLPYRFPGFGIVHSPASSRPNATVCLDPDVFLVGTLATICYSKR